MPTALILNGTSEGDQRWPMRQSAIRIGTRHIRSTRSDEMIPATGRGKAKIASLIRISRQHLYDILNGRKPVSPAVAVRLGKLFGDGAGVWTRMQAAYDTWHAEREEDVRAIPTIKTRAA